MSTPISAQFALARAKTDTGAALLPVTRVRHESTRDEMTNAEVRWDR